MKRFVIVGGVAGGMSAATRLRRLDEEAEIIVLERSGYVSYANCGLPYYVGGIIEDESSLLLQTPASLRARFSLDVRINSEVLGIDSKKKFVHVLNKENNEEYQLPYDKLILSTGATPIVPPIIGVERALTLRNIEDVERIVSELSKKPKSAVVIGGGFIGLEIAENLVHRGISTCLVEASAQVLPPLDPEMATLVAAELIKNGVNLLLGTSAAEITSESVLLKDGSQIPGELVIMAIGVKPDISLAGAAGLKIGIKGGVAVDDFYRTSDENIYAIGDMVEKIDELDGSATLVPLANIANRQGRIVADHIAGKNVRSIKTIGTAIVKVFNLAIATTGWNEKKLTAAQVKYQVIHSHPNSHASYYPGAEPMTIKLIFSPESGEIFGAQGVGQEGVDKRIDVIATAIRGGITAPELADLELAYAPPFGSAKDPVNMLGYMAENVITGFVQTAQWNEVEAYRQSGYQIVDVRSSSEFERGSIPGSINIPVDEIRNRSNELLHKRVLVTCQVGQRGHTATLILKSFGFNAVNLDGGYHLWSQSPVGSPEFLSSHGMVPMEKNKRKEEAHV